MPTVVDYMFNADAAQAKNRLMEQQAQLAPINSMITAQNAATKSGQLEQSKARFNNVYAFYKAFSALPKAVKDQLASQPEIAANISQLTHQLGANAVADMTGMDINQINKISGMPSTAAPSPTAIPAQSPAMDATTQGVIKGAQNDYIKDTTDTAQRNRYRFGKNLETTLSQADQLIPSVMKFAGNNGALLKKGDPELAALGISDNDYDNFNRYKNEVAEQATSQIRQFYGDSIQPSVRDQIGDRLIPARTETPQQFNNRYKLLRKNIEAELNQTGQDYTSTFNTKPIDISGALLPAGAPAQQAPDFSSLLASRGVK